MPWSLAEFSKIETDVLRKSVIDTLLMETNILELIPFETIGQLTTGFVRMQDLPSVGFRRVNGSYPEGIGRFEQKVEQIALMGGNIDTDKAIARAKNTVGDARAIQQQMMLKAMAYRYNYAFINGDPAVPDPTWTQGTLGDARSVGGGAPFKGLHIRTTEAHAETGSQIITSDAGYILDEANWHDFLDELDELIYSVAGHQPDYLLMNRQTLLALRSILRRARLLDTTKDMFDRRVDVYQGCRLIDMGSALLRTNPDASPEEASTWTDIIPVTNGVSSIYAVKFGVGDLTWGIAEYPLEVEDLGMLKEKPVYRTMVDFPCGLATVDPRSVARLDNVTLVSGS